MFSVDLHNRFITTFVSILVVSAIIYMGLTTLLVQNLERTLAATLISHEIDELVTDLASDPEIKLPKTASVQAYLSSRDHLTPLPDELRNLSSDVHSKVSIDNHIYEVAIMEFNGDKLYILFDVTEVSRYLSILLIILFSGGVIGILFLIVFAVWFFKKHLTPVSTLAAEVANIDPNERNVRIAAEYQEFEVGLIAQSIDQFMDRLDSFVEREQAFTAAVSHELRTPVTVIATSIELLELKKVTDEQQIVINRIKNSLKYMNNVIETLLFFARNIHHIVEKTLPEIGLNELFVEVLVAHEILASEKNIELKFRGKTKKTVRMVANHLEIVLGNLVQNAINNTDRGEVKVTLNEGGFSVKDTGRGIGAEDIKHIVERNYHSANNDGKGLGLFLVKHICDIYKFKLEVESEVGRGSTFTIDFNENFQDYPDKGIRQIDKLLQLKTKPIHN